MVSSMTRRNRVIFDSVTPWSPSISYTDGLPTDTIGPVHAYILIGGRRGGKGVLSLCMAVVV